MSDFLCPELEFCHVLPRLRVAYARGRDHYANSPVLEGIFRATQVGQAKHGFSTLLLDKANSTSSSSQGGSLSFGSSNGPSSAGGQIQDQDRYNELEIALKSMETWRWMSPAVLMLVKQLCIVSNVRKFASVRMWEKVLAQTESAQDTRVRVGKFEKLQGLIYRNPLPDSSNDGSYSWDNNVDVRESILKLSMPSTDGATPPPASLPMSTTVLTPIPALCDFVPIDGRLAVDMNELVRRSGSGEDENQEVEEMAIEEDMRLFRREATVRTSLHLVLHGLHRGRVVGEVGKIDADKVSCEALDVVLEEIDEFSDEIDAVYHFNAQLRQLSEMRKLYVMRIDMFIVLFLCFIVVMFHHH